MRIERLPNDSSGFLALGTLAAGAVVALLSMACWGQDVALLPVGVQPVWDLNPADRQATPTRERACLNGLWRWQPADPLVDRVPDTGWGHFKVPGPWPGITDYMQKDCQTVHRHPSWQDVRMASVKAAWYQREITIPPTWADRRIAVAAEYLNSFAVVYVDGQRAGEMRFPAGEVDLGTHCRPGETHTLSVLVVAMPLQGVRLSHNDSNAAREVQGSVARRGFCGDVFLVATPRGPRLADVHVRTSVRDERIAVDVEILDLLPEGAYTLGFEVKEQERIVERFAGERFVVGDLREGRLTVSRAWRPERLWDTHTPRQQYEVSVALLDDEGRELDVQWPIRFGFREFWIDGRDFYLNGSRIFLSAVPLDNAQVGAALATYEAARESLERLQSFGINFVYTHNYDCQPGSHLSFAEILRAADDVGMLVALSQPHFSDYDWREPDAERTNGYSEHAAFYARVAGNHPSVVMYATSHNATGYNEDMRPDAIDGRYDRRDQWALNNARRALRAEAVIRCIDPSRIVYHHSSGNLGSMHTSNFYPNLVPIQELSDWFEHWATAGVKPFFACEYGAPFTWDWAMYRGWFEGKREFGSAAVPWDFCLAEWNAQFLGDAAFQISQQEKRNIRWEAEQFRRGGGWHRWDYPHQLGSADFDERYPVLARYLEHNWRAFRTWGVSAISPWEHHVFWKRRPGLDRNRRVELATDWQRLQQPGFSPDFLEQRFERMDLAYDRSDWIPTLAADAMYRNNRPLLAYLAGKPQRFTSQDHNFLPGETVEKQIVVVNNSRRTVACQYAWSFVVKGSSNGFDTPSERRGAVRVETGEKARIPVSVSLPDDLEPGEYELSLQAQFVAEGSDGGEEQIELQEDRFAVHVLEPVRPEQWPTPMPDRVRVALFDPSGETGRLLEARGFSYQTITADADLVAFDLLVIGKQALSPDGPAPDLGQRVPQGLKVLVFEQTAEVLERRLGFRVQEYGLRNLFPRVPDHPLLMGLAAPHLRDWRGEATLTPPDLGCQPSPRYNGAPTVLWCGLEVPRLWRCGNQGNVASVLIEKPARGDFLPIVDGGFSLQYSPLLEYREGAGVVLFCQVDVTGRTESDPAAERLLNNLLAYMLEWRPERRRQVVYAGEPAGRAWLESAGLSCQLYSGGELALDQVLVATPGSGDVLAPHAEELARWLSGGGRLLAVEMDADEVNRFLPWAIVTQGGEHIAARFDPPAWNSPLAGVSPADIHNRVPRELPLVTGGTRVVGNGVLAYRDDGAVVFCQYAPYRIEHGRGGATSPSASSQQNVRRTYRRASFLLGRLLANMGVAADTPLLVRFTTPVSDDAAAHGEATPSVSPMQGRWLSGLYADVPQEWDDPYRFFRW